MGFCACTDDSDDIFINENQISTRAVNGAYTYPDVSEILKQDVVKKQMNEAWNLMKKTASSASRSEYGFYIYKSQTSGKYYVGKMVKGPAITGCAGTKRKYIVGSTNFKTLMFVLFFIAIQHSIIVLKQQKRSPPSAGCPPRKNRSSVDSSRIFVSIK